MKIEEMTPEERSALGSLVHVIVRLDGSYSLQESDEIQVVADRLGADGFWKAVDAAGEEDLSDEAVMARARAVVRAEAREEIYGAILDIAESGSIVGSESSLLDWLGKEWGIASG